VSESAEARPESATREDALDVAGPPIQDTATQAAVPLDERPRARRLRRERGFEVAAAIALAVVAVATAWSGYQATRWTDRQSARYAQASAQRVAATREATLAGQLRLYDQVLVNNWLNAHATGNTALENVFRRRFRPEFQPVFDAWLALDPLNNPDAPPGPLFMPEYPSSLPATSDQLEAQADQAFVEGQAAAEQSAAYVLNTVFLAMVLFLTSMAERFEWHPLRAAILGLAMIMLLFAVYHLVVYPVIA
jgi:hypothetical protein